MEKEKAEMTNIPSNLNQTIGKLGVRKGTYNGDIQLVSWDALPDCNGERCIISEICTYDHGVKCQVQRQYLRSVMEMIFTNYADKMTEAQLFQVGMHLMPLYKTLSKLKIEELAVQRIITVDDRGMVRVNPVYKEIRETIKLLTHVWKSIGMSGPGPGAPDVSDDYLLNGDVGAYERMSANADDSNASHANNRKKKLKRK